MYLNSGVGLEFVKWEEGRMGDTLKERRHIWKCI